MDGQGSCPHRGTECTKAQCSHWDSRKEQCIFTSIEDKLTQIKKVLDDILAK